MNSFFIKNKTFIITNNNSSNSNSNISISLIGEIVNQKRTYIKYICKANTVITQTDIAHRVGFSNDLILNDFMFDHLLAKDFQESTRCIMVDYLREVDRYQLYKLYGKLGIDYIYKDFKFKESTVYKSLTSYDTYSNYIYILSSTYRFIWIGKIPYHYCVTYYLRLDSISYSKVLKSENVLEICKIDRLLVYSYVFINDSIDREVLDKILIDIDNRIAIEYRSTKIELLIKNLINQNKLNIFLDKKDNDSK